MKQTASNTLARPLLEYSQTGLSKNRRDDKTGRSIIIAN